MQRAVLDRGDAKAASAGVVTTKGFAELSVTRRHRLLEFLFKRLEEDGATKSHRNQYSRKLLRNFSSDAGVPPKLGDVAAILVNYTNIVNARSTLT